MQGANDSFDEPDNRPNPHIVCFVKASHELPLKLARLVGLLLT